MGGFWCVNSGKNTVRCGRWGGYYKIDLHMFVCVERAYLCLSCMCSADERFQAQKYAELEGEAALVEEREGAIRQLEVSSSSVGCLQYMCSLVPRPFPPPVFDRLQYTNMEGEGLGISSSAVM